MTIAALSLSSQAFARGGSMEGGGRGPSGSAGGQQMGSAMSTAEGSTMHNGSGGSMHQGAMNGTGPQGMNQGGTGNVLSNHQQKHASGNGSAHVSTSTKPAIN
jgi:hypothetical protein